MNFLVPLCHYELCILHSILQNFVLRNQSDYKDKGSNLGRQYWMDRGGLRVMGGTDYSQKNRKKTFAEQNAFAIGKLIG